MLKTRGIDLAGKTVLVSGAGNVAQYTIEKLIQLGAKPLTCSDSDGFVYDPDGIDADKLAYIMELKNIERGRIKEYAEEYPNAQYFLVSVLGASRPTSPHHALPRTRSAERMHRNSSTMASLP